MGQREGVCTDLSTSDSSSSGSAQRTIPPQWYGLSDAYVDRLGEVALLMMQHLDHNHPFGTVYQSRSSSPSRPGGNRTSMIA